MAMLLRNKDICSLCLTIDERHKFTKPKHLPGEINTAGKGHVCVICCCLAFLNQHMLRAIGLAEDRQESDITLKTSYRKLDETLEESSEDLSPCLVLLRKPSVIWDCIHSAYCLACDRMRLNAIPGPGPGPRPNAASGGISLTPWSRTLPVH